MQNWNSARALMLAWALLGCGKDSAEKHPNTQAANEDVPRKACRKAVEDAARFKTEWSSNDPLVQLQPIREGLYVGNSVLFQTAAGAFEKMKYRCSYAGEVAKVDVVPQGEKFSHEIASVVDGGLDKLKGQRVSAEDAVKRLMAGVDEQDAAIVAQAAALERATERQIVDDSLMGLTDLRKFADGTHLEGEDLSASVKEIIDRDQHRYDITVATVTDMVAKLKAKVKAQRLRAQANERDNREAKAQCEAKPWTCRIH